MDGSSWNITGRWCCMFSSPSGQVLTLTNRFGFYFRSRHVLHAVCFQFFILCVCVCVSHVCSPQYEEAKAELSDLQEKYEKTEQEKQSIADELEECKASVKDLEEKGSKVSADVSI